MDQIGYGTNRPYYLDFLRLCLPKKRVDFDHLRQLYEKKGLSAKQIAQELGVSKTFVIDKIRHLEIVKQAAGNRQTNPENYRFHNPPYGYQVKDSKLVLNSSELKVCRLIVDLLGHQGWSVKRTAEELQQRGFKSRQGSDVWHHTFIRSVFKRWHGKL